MQSVPRLNTIFTPTHYTLSLNIDRLGRSFSGTVSIEGTSLEGAADIQLHSKDLEITSATIDGHEASWQYSQYDGLALTYDQHAPGKHIVVLGFSGKITDAMHGLYPCYFEHEGEKKELIATQFESHHAREVFPCVDEPEAKATFDLTLTTEPSITVLGNMPVKDQHEEDGRLVTTFDRSPRMSSYLLAWVCGELHRKTATTTAGVEVNVWATPAQAPEALDFALDHAVKTIDFFDDYFGVPYPLPKSDHVALPDFTSGAMENWGLVTYREVALLADPATTTVASKQYIATVISHELSHQWFGNLVTMKWWNNLWLNESFATLMEYLAVDAIHPEWNAWLDFATQESIFALRRDALDGVQPVQIDVNHPDEIASIFDPAIVYAKGARLMRMCQHYIGTEAFQKGLQTYFTEFAYQNTEADDLWQHLSAASGKDIAGMMNTWISQSGYPVVSVASDRLTQERFFIGEHQPSTQLWPIPLNAESEEDVPLLLEAAELRLPIADDERLNVGDTAHFITEYSHDHLMRILNNPALTSLDKLQLLHEQTLLVRAGRVQSASLIDLLEHYRDETDQHVWDIMALSFAELKKFVETSEPAEQALRAFAGRLARPLYEKLGWDIVPGESEDDTKLRGTILGMMIYSQDSDVLGHVDTLYSSGIEAIDPEVRGLVLSSVVYRASDLDVVRYLFDMYKSTSSADPQHDICDGITSVRQPEHVAHVIGKLTDTSLIRPQDNTRWFAFLIRNRYAREATWAWLRDNWDWVEQQFGGDKSFDNYPRYAAAGLMTPTQRDEYQAFFTPKRDNPALTRVIDLGLTEINARLELLERDGEAVRTRLLEL